MWNVKPIPRPGADSFSFQEMSNHVFQSRYNLYRLNKGRQEEAVPAGMRVIESSSPLKKFALPILYDLASVGKSCRMLLRQHDGLAMYIKLLTDPYFQVSALQSILSWFVHSFRARHVQLTPIMNRALVVERYCIHETVAALRCKDGAVLDREIDREIDPSLAPALKISFRGVDVPGAL